MPATSRDGLNVQNMALCTESGNSVGTFHILSVLRPSIVRPYVMFLYTEAA